jgi:hypothetical protein
MSWASLTQLQSRGSSWQQQADCLEQQSSLGCCSEPTSDLLMVGVTLVFHGQLRSLGAGSSYCHMCAVCLRDSCTLLSAVAIQGTQLH